MHYSFIKTRSIVEEKIYTHPVSGTNYTIDSYKFVYSQNRPPVFCIIFQVTIPRHEQPAQQIRATMEIKSFLHYVESQNPALAKYLKSVVKGFSGKPKHEMLAFRSLEKEGFDMNRIVECIMNDADISFSEDN